MPPRSPTASAGFPGQFVARSDTCREHDQIQVEFGAVGEFGEQPLVGRLDGLGGHPGVHGEVELFDQSAQQAAAAVVDLDRHQPRPELDDVRRHAHTAQRVRCLQPEQAAADHHRRRTTGCGLGAVHRGVDGVEVVDGAVDEAAGQVVAGNRWHERLRAGRQHQRVVVLAEPGGGAHDA